MVKPNDALLKHMGINIPEITVGKRKNIKPLMSSSIYHGKGLEKGNVYTGSPYLDIIDTMEEVANGYNDITVDIMTNGLVLEATQMVEYGKEQGVRFALPTFSEVKTLMEDGQRSDSPVQLLIDYRRDISRMSQPINDLRQELLAKLKDAGLHLTHPEKKSLDWLLNKTGASRQVVDYAASLEYAKDAVMAEYQAKAEAYNYGGEECSPGVLYAQLYLLNAEEENNIRRYLQEWLPNNVSTQKIPLRFRKYVPIYKAYLKKFIEKHGMTNLTMDMMKTISAHTVSKHYSDSGFSSIQSLFPLGAVQFLEFTKSGIKTKRQAPKNVIAYFEADHELTDEEREGWAQMLFESVVIENGQLNGLTLSSDNRLAAETEVVLTSNKLELQRSGVLNYFSEKPDVIKELLLNTPFLSGGKYWASEKQEAKVLHAIVYKRSVRLYLGGLRNVGDTSHIHEQESVSMAMDNPHGFDAPPAEVHFAYDALSDDDLA